MDHTFRNFGELYLYLEQGSPKEHFIHDRHAKVWESISKEKFLQNVRYLTLSLFERGYRAKQIAISLAPSSYWLMIDYACMLSGAVCVPLFTNISSKNLLFQLADANIYTVFIASEADEKLIRQADKGIEVITVNKNMDDSETFEDLLLEGKALNKSKPLLFDQLLDDLKEDDLVTIVYTSGTSGVPKGVELTHTNLLSQIRGTAENYIFKKEVDTALSFLPLAHIFERMVMHFYLSRELSIYFADDVKNVGEILKEVNPTVMTVVPRLLEKVYFKMKTKAMDGNFIKKGLVSLAFYRATTKDPTSNLTLLDKFLDALVYKKLRLAFGDKIRMLISGGAPLSDSLYRFYLNIGTKVYQGYGLTESSPVIASNTPEQNKVSTCGKAFPQVEVKLSPQGELLARGKNIMRGYHHNQKATNKVVDTEGWLHTGDLATVDDEGYITITGRDKELFKTSTGEYVSSVFIEQALTSNGWFEFALLVGDNKPYVVALLFVEHGFLGTLAKKMHMTPLKVLQSKKFKDMTDKFIIKVNKKLNHWEKVREYRIIPDELSIENGFLTPSMKLAKKALMVHYSNKIDEMYKDHL